MKKVLLLHLYVGERFVGQTLLWIEGFSDNKLGYLLDLLAQGVRSARDESDSSTPRFHGTEVYPTQTNDFRVLNEALQRAFDYPFRLIYKGAKLDSKEWNQIDSARVIQIMDDWGPQPPRP